jgi:DNA-binding transcriptional LysR family regulator
VRSLERELGAKLFVRNTRNVELTAAGKALLAEAMRILRSVRAAKEAVDDVQGLLRGRLSVGTEQCVAGVNVPALLARFRSAHPQVEIRLHQSDSSTLIAEVGAGRLDLAFVAAPRVAPTDVQLLPLMHEPLVLLCPADHPLNGSAEVKWDELMDESFVDFHTTWGTRQLTDDAFAAASVRRQVTLEVNDVHTLIDLVAYGLGLAVVPKPIADKPQAATLCSIRLTGADPEPTWQLSVAVPPGDAATPAARRLLSYLPQATLVAT